MYYNYDNISLTTIQGEHLSCNPCILWSLNILVKTHVEYYEILNFLKKKYMKYACILKNNYGKSMNFYKHYGTLFTYLIL